jgi:hypothetical protein
VLEDKIFGTNKVKVTGNLDSSQVQTQMGMNTMKFCDNKNKYDQARAKAVVGEKMREKMMKQVKGQIMDIMAKKQENRRRETKINSNAFRS